MTLKATGIRAHPRPSAVNLLPFHANGRDLHTGVGAEDGDFFFALVRWDGEDGVEHERRDHGAVLTATVADEPRAWVVKVQLPERIFNNPVT